MINKVYEKIVRFIKEEYKFLLVCLVIILLGVIKLPYNLYTGGGIINLNDRIEIDNAKSESGSFNLAYVRESRATVPLYLLSYLFSWDRESIESVKVTSNDTVSDMWKREKMYLQEANDNAIINAYRAAKEDITIKKEMYKVLYILDEADTNLMIGDIIISIDSRPVTSYDDLKFINKYEGDSVLLLVNRDNKEIECYAKVIKVDDKEIMGISLIKLYDYETTRKINLKFLDREGGSSGGMMLSLAIYNRLVDKDITNGLKIVGTGTIDSDGNIGEIGGVKYKLMGAVSEDADLFLVANANYEEAMKVKKEKDYEIDIVKVNTLKEAIEYLESR